MAAPNYWRNNDGLNVRFNTRDSQDGSKRPGEMNTRRKERPLRLEFQHGRYPGPREDDVGLVKIPAGSYILRAYLLVDEAWVDGTSLQVNLVQDDGTEVDDEGIFTAAELATAELTAGAVIEADGGSSIGAVVDEDAYLEVEATGTYTAGTAELVVEFMPKYDGRLTDA